MARQKTGNEKQTTLRLPAEMMTVLQELAEKENRSVNAQIITLLQEALDMREVDAAINQQPLLH